MKTPVVSIAAAAARLGTSPRMLRYREAVGLLASDRTGVGTHRRYSPRDLDVAAAAIALEQRYDVSPATLAFALRAVFEPRVAADLRDLARRSGRVPAASLAALDFDQRKAQELLRVRARQLSLGGPGARSDVDHVGGTPTGGGAKPS